MGFDSELIAEATKMTTQHPICPRCHQSRLQVNDEGGKDCPSCGYKVPPKNPNYQDPIGESTGRYEVKINDRGEDLLWQIWDNKVGRKIAACLIEEHADILSRALNSNNWID